MTILTLEDRQEARDTIRYLKSMVEIVEAVGRGEKKGTRRTIEVLHSLTGATGLEQQHAALSHFLKEAQDDYLERLIVAGRSDLSAFAEAINLDEPPARHHHLLCDFLNGVERGDYRYGMVSMPPGHAKDLDVETPILMNDGTYKRLGDIAVGDRVITMLGRAREVAAVHEQGVRPVLKIVTRSGRTIRAHPEHLFFTPAGWTAAGDLIVNDQLALVREFEIPDTSGMGRDAFILAGYMLSIGFSRSAATSKLDKITREFRHRDQAIIDDFRATAKRMGFKTEVLKRSRYGKHTQTVVLDDKGAEWLREHELFDLQRREARPPEWIFKGDANKIALFLGALFSCDAKFRPGLNNHTHQARRVMVEVRNGGLLDDIQKLLQRLGVRSKRSSNLRTCYNYKETVFQKLFVEEPEDQRRMARRIRFVGKHVDAWSEPIRGGGFDDDGRLYSSDPIVSIEPDGETETRCLTIDEDESFLAADIVVHNSTYATHMFPAWYLGKHPTHRYLQAGHTQKFVEKKFSRRVKAIIGLPVYQRMFPEVFVHPTDDGNSNWLLSNERGEYTGKGVGQGISGERAHCAGVDDPYPTKEKAESSTYRDEVWDWYVNDFRTRRLPTAPLFIVATRWHVDDLCGRIEARIKDGTIDEDWYIINLPALCEDPEVDLLNRQIDEPLWPEFYSYKFLAEQRAISTPAEWGCIYQGNPAPEEGNVVKSEWLKTYTKLPPKEEWRRVIVTGDTAETETARSDWTVLISIMETFSGDFYILGLIRKRMSMTELFDAVDNLAMADNCTDVVVEDKGMGHHLVVNRPLQDPRPSYAITGMPTNNKTKEFRLDAVTWIMRAGRLYLPESAPWLATFMTELLKFPAVKHDDQVDALAYGLKWLAGTGTRHLGTTKLRGTK